MEGTKTCPIYPCVPSLEKSWIRPWMGIQNLHAGMF
jgi:hypothetical protein